MTSLAKLNQLDRGEFTAVLGHLFEHSPWVAEETWPRRAFRDVDHLHAELCTTLRSAPVERQRAVIEAHPDLAGRLALAGKLTPESTREQASAGLNQMSGEEMAAFQRLNAAYRAKFGMPFVICARLNAREAIIHAMETRLAHSPVDEHEAALVEIERIARLRLADVI
jgi:2-oxo-4-hydroxy-4-carboxy-5-ureidoimidazoline decarboxylase